MVRKKRDTKRRTSLKKKRGFLKGKRTNKKGKKRAKRRGKRRTKKVSSQKNRIVAEKPKEKIVLKINEMLKSRAVKKDIPVYEPFNNSEKPKLLNSEEMGVVKTALENPVRNKDKKAELLRNSDISSMKKSSKRNSSLLPPSKLTEVLHELSNNKTRKKRKKKSK